jgi:hypothetical protein
VPTVSLAQNVDWGARMWVKVTRWHTLFICFALLALTILGIVAIWGEELGLSAFLGAQ